MHEINRVRPIQLAKCVFALSVGLVATILASSPVEASPVVSPPISIKANCSVDVSSVMQHWLSSLPASTTVDIPAGACYLVDEGLKLIGSQGLTISGGAWDDATVPQPNGEPQALNPVFWFVGGSNITLENLSITGVNPGGYHPAGAFIAGIRSDGVTGLNLSNITIDNVYGDGIELAPLRAQGDVGSTILNPTTDATISDINISGSGRQGITLASVNNALISSVRLAHVGIDVFDLEADQWNEGARNVTIDGCVAGADNGALFFANGGSGGGGNWTQNITVENCAMSTQEAGDAVLIQTPADQPKPRGPFTFSNDTLRCGASVYVACVQVTGADVSINQSSLIIPPGTVHEAAYNATDGSTVALNGDSVSGYGTAGSVDRSSSVSVTSGTWTPFEPVATGSHPPSLPPPSTPGPTGAPPIGPVGHPVASPLIASRPASVTSAPDAPVTTGQSVGPGSSSLVKESGKADNGLGTGSGRVRRSSSKAGV